MNNRKPLERDIKPSSETITKRLWSNITQTDRPGIYITIVLMIAIAGSVSGMRSQGIFACQDLSRGYDRYAAYCQATNFGDYDHGAFWFNLEPNAVKAASEATVLFIGNSRMQFGLSTDVLQQWFSSNSINYYLLGFSHFENQTFFRPLLKKLRSEADVYIINLDLFFEQRISNPADSVMNDPEALNRYTEKRRWQKFHTFFCGNAGILCRNEVTFFRSRANGTWLRTGGEFGSYPVIVDDTVNPETLAEYRKHATAFISSLPNQPKCVILTNTPQTSTTSGTARALAESLGLPLIAPPIADLTTFDESHLDVASASQWSTAFVEALEPYLRACLSEIGE